MRKLSNSSIRLLLLFVLFAFSGQGLAEDFGEKRQTEVVKAVNEIIDETSLDAKTKNALKTQTKRAINTTMAQQTVLPPTMATIIVGVALALIFIAMMVIATTLSSKEGYSLADALSEEAEVSKDVDEGQEETTEVRMVASTSRLIAFMGMVFVLIYFVAIMAVGLYQLSLWGDVPENFTLLLESLVYGLTLFAPYMVNKFASVFETLKTPGAG